MDGGGVGELGESAWARVREVGEAVRVAYRLTKEVPTSESNARAAAAAEALVAFAHHPDGWFVWPALLSTASEGAVQFHAASALGKKVRHEWTTLSPSARTGVESQLWQVLLPTAERCDLAVVRTLCVGLATTAVQDGEGDVEARLHAVLTRVGDLVVHVGGDGSRAAAITAAVELLRALPEQVDEQLNGARRDAAIAAMVGVVSTVMSVYQSLLVVAGGCDDGGGIPAPPLPLLAIAADPGAAPAALRLSASALHGMEWWCRTCNQGLHAVHAALPDLVDVVITVALTSMHNDLSQRGSDVLATWMHQSVPRDGPGLVTAAMERCLVIIVARILCATPALVEALRVEAIDEERAATAVSTLLAVMESQYDWLCTGGATALPADDTGLPPPAWCLTLADMEGLTSCATGGEASQLRWRDLTVHGCAVGLGVMWADALVQLLPLLPHASVDKVVAAMLPWHTVDTDRRHPYFRKHVWRHTVSAVCRIIAHPVTGTEQWRATHAGREAWADLRSDTSSLTDLMSDSFVALGDELITLLARQVHTQYQQLMAVPAVAEGGAPAATAALILGHPAASSAGVPTWQPLESALYCLTLVSSDVCALLEEEDMVDGNAVEHVVALLCLVAGAPDIMSMPPELSCTVCTWLGSLAPWWMVMDLATSLRCADLFHRAHDAEGGAGRLDASITLLPASDLFNASVQLLFAGLQAVACHTAACPLPPTLPTMAATPAATEAAVTELLNLLGAESGGLVRREGAAPPPSGSHGTPSRLNDDGDADGGDAGGEEHGGGGDGARLITCWVPVAAAAALESVCTKCARVLAEAGLVQALTAAVHAAQDADLPPAVVCGVLRGTLLVASRLPPATLPSVLAPLVTPMADRLAAILAAVPPGGGCTPPTTRIPLLRHTLYLVTALSQHCLDAGGVTGMGGLGLADLAGPGAEEAVAAATASPLQFLVDAVWPVVEGAMIAVHDDETVVSALLALLQQCIRASHRTVVGRIPSLTRMATHLYDAHLYAQALATCAAAVDVLPTSGGDSIGFTLEAPEVHPEVAAFLLDLMDSVTRTTHAAAHAPSTTAAGGRCDGPLLANRPEAAQEYFILAQRVLCAAPTAIIHATTLPAALPLAAAVFHLFHVGAAHAAADFIDALLSRPDIQAAPFQPIVMGVIVDHGASMMETMMMVLLDDRASVVERWVVKALLVMLKVFGAAGGTEALQLALARCHETAVAVDPPIVDEESGEVIPPTTGMAALDARFQAFIARQATLFATVPDGSKRFGMLMRDVSRVGRRLDTVDALGSHDITEHDLLHPRTPRSAMARGRESRVGYRDGGSSGVRRG